MPVSPPPGTRLVLMHEELMQDTLGSFNSRGEQLFYDWGEPDENGWYTPTIMVTPVEDPLRSTPAGSSMVEPGEVFFLTSGDRLLTAMKHVYNSYDNAVALEATRTLMRYIEIPSAIDGG